MMEGYIQAELVTTFLNLPSQKHTAYGVTFLQRLIRITSL